MTFREWLGEEMMSLHGSELRLINRIKEEFDRRFTKWGDPVEPYQVWHERLHIEEHGLDLLELAWVIIANAGGGDWTTQTQDWQKAATRWRENYHKLLDSMTREGQGDE